jgi:tRNA-dihydrouridine synthase C
LTVPERDGAPGQPAFPSGPTIVGRNPQRVVHFPQPLLLAPMEGVTDRVFRDLVIELGGVGGACSEFIRISSSAMSARVIRRQLGPQHDQAPVGVQFMASEPTFLPESIRAAEQVGAVWIDLNFGCPAPVVFNKCAGSALLGTPEKLAAIVRAAVAAAQVPVSAKIRAGIADATRLDEIVHAVCEAGAAMLTVHARLRCQAYSQPATWEWIAIAKRRALACGRPLPVVGNGGISSQDDAARMMAETGCDAVMVGRGALSDPWIFRTCAGGPPGSTDEAVDFAIRYAALIESTHGVRAALAKLKQLVRWYSAGRLFAGCEEQRGALLRCLDLATVRAWFAARRSDQGMR